MSVAGYVRSECFRSARLVLGYERLAGRLEVKDSVRRAPLRKVCVHLVHLALETIQLGLGDTATDQQVDEILDGRQPSVGGQDRDARQRVVVHGV